MHGHEILVFLLSLAILLGVARLLGELARGLGLPLVVGEISAGILLGDTGLRHLAPQAHAFLFTDPVASSMLSGYTTIGVVLLLVVAGLEIDLGVVRQRGLRSVGVGALGLILPMIGGILLGFVVPDSAVGHPEQRTLFAIFLGVALSISALPVIAKTLLDLGLMKTDIGLLVMTTAMVDDLVGWIAFSVLLGPLRGGSIDIAKLGSTIGLAALFVAFSLSIGRRLVDRALAKLVESADVAPGRILTFVIVVALFGAAATQAIGIHAVLGGFIVGVTLGDSRHLRERTRRVIQHFVMNVFAPVFFASVAMRVDFVANFDLSLCLSVFVVATLTKLVGCGLGARLSGMPWREALAVGFGLNARGAMGIILAIVAHETHVLNEKGFVALVAMALGTSLLAGPAMRLLLLSDERAEGGAMHDAASLVREGAFVPKLDATTSARAIEALANALRPTLGDLVEPALIAVLERELVAPTGLGDEVAIPHASVEGLKQPAVALGLAPDGIDFDAPDGRPARIVFLLLLPPHAYEKEVHVLASLARSVFDGAAREALLACTSAEVAVRILDEHGRRNAKGPQPPRSASVADI